MALQPARRGVIELTPRQLRAVLLVLAAVVPAVLVMLGVVVYRNVNDGSTPPRPVAQPASAETVRARSIVSWTAAALPRDSVVAADRSVLPMLRGAGFTRAVAFGSPAARDGVQYVLDAGIAVLPASQALACEGSTCLRELTQGPSADVRDRVRADAELRGAGGRQLLANRAVSTDGTAGSALGAGLVDLRIQNVVADLAAAQPVRLSAPLRDRREQRAGLPVRSIVLGTSADATTLQNRLRALPEPYRPRSVTPTGAHTLRAVWLPAIAPDLPVGN